MDEQTKIFIEKCKKKYGDKFDYSKVVYRGSHENVTIICPKHGEFSVSATNFLSRGKCPKCNQEKKQKGKLFNDFLSKAKSLYEDKYSYEKVEYKTCKDKIIVTCKKHGDFEVIPEHFIMGQECPECTKERHRLELQNKFLKSLKSIYGGRFDTSKVHYKNEKTHVILTCKKHGDFYATPPLILRGGCFCPKCNEENKKEQEQIRQKEIKAKQISKREKIIHNFFEKSAQIHNNKYDYSKSEYINSSTKICIICPEHGEFWQTPNTHLDGKGCPKCCGKNKTTEDFIKEAQKIHGDKYDYSKVDYKRASEKVCIICPEHGEFWQSPNKHLGGHGCPICKESHLEREVRNYLIKNNFEFEEYIKPKFLNGKEYDFFLPKYNIAIECQGEQHFNEKGWHSAKENYNINIKRDIEKSYESINNSIKLLYIFPREIKKEKVINNKKFQNIYNNTNIYYSINKLFKDNI